MSVTGPGCEACNFTGRMRWSDDGDGLFDDKPCDRCGGLGVFARPVVTLRGVVGHATPIGATALIDGGPCPNCDGVGTLAATTYSVNGPARYPCGACGGMGRRLVPSPSGPQRFAVVPCAAVVIAPEDDWRPLPSVAEVLAHNARTGGDCYGPWMCIADPTDEWEPARVIMLAVAGAYEGGDEVIAEAGRPDVIANPDTRVRPITRRGEALPWPEVKR